MKIGEVRVGQSVLIENQTDKYVITVIDTDTYVILVKRKTPFGLSFYAIRYYVWLLIDDSPPLEQLARVLLDED